MIVNAGGDVFARCSNANLSPTEIEALIEQAVIAVSAEIQERGWQAYETAKSLYASNLEREKTQAAEAAGVHARWEQEAIAGKERNRILKIAEDNFPGPRRV